MSLLSILETPFELQLSFYQIIENLEKVAADGFSVNADNARALLAEVAPYPELRNGITDAVQVEKNAALISRLLADYFPPELTLNEIKAVNIPYTGITFNHTERFKNILKAAGTGFEINIRDFDEHQFYVLSCCIILNECYGTRLDFAKPMFYDIPTADGITRHYRILYNADFLDIVPTEKSLALTQDDIDLLLNNYDNITLWKEKFPKESWILKGFAIMTLFDATVENAVSIFKEKLLGGYNADFRESVESIFRSIYRIPDIRIGFTVYNREEGKFSKESFGQLHSFILPDADDKNAKDLLCTGSYRKLIEKKIYFAVSDTAAFLEENPESHVAKEFLSQNIHSCILAPIVKNGQLLGVLEVVSPRTKELNSINANKLEVVMPFLTDTVERLLEELQNQLQAVIQDKFTAIHESVYWKFRDEAQKLIYEKQRGNDYTINEIVFADVYPLYGQVDIKGSSEVRNSSVQEDLQQQLQALLTLLHELNNQNFPDLFEDEQVQVSEYLDEVSSPVKAGTEQYINNYLGGKVHPQLKQITNEALLPAINHYFNETSKRKGEFHVHRRKYESTIAAINNKIAGIIDSRQAEAQAMFPHYYERFKTDGVEHNLYIGQSIAPNLTFDIQKLHDLRLWQLQVLCEMETAHHYLMPSLAYPLEVTTLILVYNTKIAIRFRMDEKRFDVDGSYNARFEIVKKRIDKALIKHSNERITQAGKVTIVYSNGVEEQEYIKYIKTLQQLGTLDSEIENFEVEDLQGVSRLKALRVGILYK